MRRKSSHIPIGSLFSKYPVQLRQKPFSFSRTICKSLSYVIFCPVLEFLNLKWRSVSHNQILLTRKYGYIFISHRNYIWKFLLELTALAAMLALSRGVQLCTHANSTLCSMRYWLVPLVTGQFLACSACYWPVPGLFRLLLTCSLLVPLVTGLFRLFRVLVTSH